MDLRKRLDDKNIWRMTNTVFMVCIVLSCAGRLLGIGVIDVRIILTSVISVLIVLFMDRTDVRGRLFGLAGIGAVLCSVGMVTGFGTCLRFVQSYCRWLINRPGWKSEWTTGYEVIQAVVLVLLCYLFALFTERNFRIKIIGVTALLAGLLYALFGEKEMPKQGVAFLICYIVLTYAEWTQRRWKKEKGQSIQAYMVWIVPFVAVYFAGMMLCAVPEQPYDWKFVKNVYQYLTESFKKMSQNIIHAGNEDYELNLNGFSKSGDIDGGRLENHRELMKIWDADGLVTNVYLSGNVYDTFDGRQWRCLSRDTSKERYMDTVQTMYAVRRYDNRYFSDYMKYAAFKIDYQYFHSRYLFTPLKLSNVIYKGENLDFNEKGGSLFFDRTKGYGTEYEVSFYQLNAGQDVFDRFLYEAGSAQPEAVQSGGMQAGVMQSDSTQTKDIQPDDTQTENVRSDEELLAGLLKDLEKRTGMTVTADDMEAHRQQVYGCYAQEVELSDEVREYVDEITEGAGTDVEKLRMIEEELAGYGYTLQPGALPPTVTDGSEFLDYFLLDVRAGYCSHFATAFVLLARAQGLPARYVQGFCVPLADGGETIVSSDMAHAWPEVYLDGIGWIPYEPTPGYQQVRYTPWILQSGNDAFGGGQGRQRSDGEKLAVSKELPDDVQEPEQTVYGAGESLRQIIRMAGVALVFAVAAVIVIGVFCRLIAAYRYSRMDAKEKLQTKVRQNMQVMALSGATRGQETLQEFRIRAESVFEDREILHFLEIYEGVLYGNDEVSQDMLEETQKQQEELLLLLKKKKRWAYLYCWFFTMSR